MTDLTTVKRLRYFDRQFLRAGDFADEQSYHLTQRQLHNRLLHTWGIAAGLEVAPATPTSVTVAPGVALDQAGHELVLPEQAAVELSSFPPGADVWITIAYDEQATDETAETGVTGKTRTTELPLVTALEGAPREPGKRLVLAIVKRAGTDVKSVDAAPRRSAGIAGGRAELLELALRAPGVDDDGWSRLRLEAPKRVSLDGGLRVGGDLAATGRFSAGPLSVSGDAAVGGSLSVTGRATVGGPLSVTGDATVGGALSVANSARFRASLTVDAMLSVGSHAVVGNAFLGSVAIESGQDWAGWSHSAQSESYALAQSRDGRTVLLNKRGGGGAFQLRIDNNPKLALLDSGDVGIGTDAPAARLHVAGGAILAAPGNDAAAGMRFPRLDMPWPNSAYVRYFKETDGVPTMLLGVESVGSRLVLEQGNRRLTMTDKTVTLSSTYEPTLLTVVGSIHAGGQYSYPGLSFADRSTPDGEVWGEEAGRRWVWYAENQQARLWTHGAYPLIVDKFGNLTVAGNITCKGVHPNGAKIGYVADAFVNPGEVALAEGEVVVLADAKPALFVGFEKKIPVPEVERATRPYDTRVCGIVAEAHGEQVATSRRKNAAQELRTFTDEERDDLDTTQVGPGQAGAMVTLGAFASCKVDASYGAIKVGDLLTTSETPGHAMKASDPARAVGAIIGKALAPRSRGQGTIPVMVFLQ